MIPQAYITEWSQQVPWQTNEQVEQQLVICRALEELLGTKLRALYQRKKGRDLYDLYNALSPKPTLDINLLLNCYPEYMKFSVDNPPSQREFILNMESKINDPEFLGYTTAILRPGQEYDALAAYELIKTELFERI